MAEAPSIVNVQIMDRDFQVKCPDDMTAQLKESALYLDQKMCELRDGGKIIGPERIAVIAALNITHELMAEQIQRKDYMSVMNDRIQALRKKIEAELNS